MMNDLTGQNAESERNRALEMVVNDRLKRLVILMRNVWVIASIKKGFRLNMELVDCLVTPLNLLVDPFKSPAHFSKTNRLPAPHQVTSHG